VVVLYRRQFLPHTFSSFFIDLGLCKDSLQGLEATESMVGTTQTAVNTLRRRKNNNNTLELRKYEIFRQEATVSASVHRDPKVSESNQSEVAVYSEILG